MLRWAKPAPISARSGVTPEGPKPEAQRTDGKSHGSGAVQQANQQGPDETDGLSWNFLRPCSGAMPPLNPSMLGVGRGVYAI